MKARIAAFGHAWRGARTLVATQPHARFHTVATVLVVGLGAGLRVTALEWALLVIAMLVVWVAEAMNTAIEFLADEVSLEWRERIKQAKDVAAFGVLAAAVGTVAVGAVVFGPYFW